MYSNKKIGKWKASRILLSVAWNIIKNRGELLLFPMWSFIASFVWILIIGIATLLLTVGSGFIGAIFGGGNLETIGNLGLVIGGIVLAIVLKMVNVYYSAAVIYTTNEHLGGNNVRNKKALQEIKKKRSKIFTWAFIDASVGIILREIVERSKVAGQIIASLIGTAWNLVTYFILPILVLEDVGIKTAGKKSVAIIRKTWGEAFITNIGVGLAMIGLVVIGFIPIILAYVLSITALLIPSGIFLVLWLLGSVLIGSTLNVIIKVVLYRYSNDLELPASIDKGAISQLYTK